jgi:plastocyanin
VHPPSRLRASLVTILLSSVLFFASHETVTQSKMLSPRENFQSGRMMEHGEVFCGIAQGPQAATAFTSDADFEIPAQPFIFTDETGREMKAPLALLDDRFSPLRTSENPFALFAPVAQTVDVMVGQNGNTFTPATVNINVGDTVRWIWSSVNHTVNSGSGCTADGSFCSPSDTSCDSNPASGTGAIYSHTFNQAGSFSYFCRIHCFSGMTGTVVVSSLCSYSISPESQSFTAAGGADTVSVTTMSGCAWTATSNDTWIMITSGASGSGNGTVNYSVAANSGAARNGTMTIAGKTFTVMQSGAASSLRIDSVAPPAGRDSGGQPVKLTGSFANLSTVTIGGVSVSWSYTNGTSEVTFTTPAHAAGAVDIVLTPTSGSTLTKTNAFAYLPTVFTDNTLTVGVTTAKAQHVIELRQAVDALRAVAGLGPAPWTDPTLSPFSTIIRAVHILELRSFLEDAASRLGYPAGTYTDPGLTSGFVIRRVHIEDLRQRVRNIAG